MIDVSFVLVSYNRKDVLRDTLNSLYEYVKEPTFEIIVVDNNSKEDNVKMLKTEFPNVKVIENIENKGFASACNLGAKNSSGKYLAFVNSDVIFYSNPLPEIISFYAKNNAGIVGLQLFNSDFSLQPCAFRFPKLSMRFLQLSGLKSILKSFIKNNQTDSKNIEVDYVSGAFLIIENELFNRISGFDERYFMYHEDADICFQSKKIGKNVYIMNTGKVVHLGNNFEELLNEFSFWHLNIGQILFYQKNYSKYSLNVLILMSIFFFKLKYFLYSFNQNKRNERELLNKITKYYIKQLNK